MKISGGIEDSEILDAKVQSELKKGVVSICYNEHANAALLKDGSVATWGNADYGGDSSSVQSKLKGKVVTKIYSTEKAFAAVLKEDGGVVTWGDVNCGGDSSSVRAKLKKGVDTIYSTDRAFAALLNDGSVVLWENNIREDLHEVNEVFKQL